VKRGCWWGNVFFSSQKKKHLLKSNLPCVTEILMFFGLMLMAKSIYFFRCIIGSTCWVVISNVSYLHPQCLYNYIYTHTIKPGQPTKKPLLPMFEGHWTCWQMNLRNAWTSLAP
jgi:hypothetical protein